MELPTRKGKRGWSEYIKTMASFQFFLVHGGGTHKQSKNEKEQPKTPVCSTGG